MCSVREHPEHVSPVHHLSTVSILALPVHSLITMNTHAHLPIIPSTAVLYYSATPCSICTAESDRNTKQKRLREIWFFFDHRENYLLNQKIRIIGALDELDLFSIDDDETKKFENSAEIPINDYPELFDFDFFQFLKKIDFSSIPISAPATF